MISLPKLLITALAATSVVIAAATPRQIADGFNSMAQKSREMQSAAQSITIDNAPLIVIGQGPFPQIIVGFTHIISTATTLAGQLNSGVAGRMVHRREIVNATEVDLIFNSFKEFSRSNQEVLNILTEKSSLIEQVPGVGPLINSLLVDLKSAIEPLYKTLFGLLSGLGGSKGRECAKEIDSLDNAVTETIEKYEDLP